MSAGADSIIKYRNPLRLRRNAEIQKEDYEKILDHCRKGLPNESCGLLGGPLRAM